MQSKNTASKHIQNIMKDESKDLSNMTQAELESLDSAEVDSLLEIHHYYLTPALN